MRKRENKNYSFVLSLPDAKFKIPKKLQKNSKKKKCQYGFIRSHHRLKEDVKGRKETLSFRSVPFLPDALKKIPKK